MTASPCERLAAFDTNPLKPRCASTGGTRDGNAGLGGDHCELTAAYGAQEPKHWGTVVRYTDGGPDPLDGVSAYRADGPAHWHFVTFGLSELYAKTSSDATVSGWGIELSLRLVRANGATSPPEWPVIMLQNLARYVYNTKMPFDHEHYIRWGGPITKAEPTRLEGLVFSTDPVLGDLETPNGLVRFLGTIGITEDEHALADTQGPEVLLRKLLPGNPLGVVDLGRASVLPA